MKQIMKITQEDEEEEDATEKPEFVKDREREDDFLVAGKDKWDSPPFGSNACFVWNLLTVFTRKNEKAGGLVSYKKFKKRYEKVTKNFPGHEVVNDHYEDIRFWGNDENPPTHLETALFELMRKNVVDCYGQDERRDEPTKLFLIKPYPYAHGK